jgi:hypothetical protein
MDTTKLERKPLTVNWRDINKDIHQVPFNDSTPTDDNMTQGEDYGKEVSDAPELEPMEHDTLRWLDDGLPEDLSYAGHHAFDLETEFDVHHFLDILADEQAGPGQHIYTQKPVETHMTKFASEENEASAAAVIPDDDEWGQWRKF